MKINLLITLLMFFMLPGCASYRNLGTLPTEQYEFEKPLAELKSAYPEIETYERGKYFFGYCTPIEQVIEKLGEPDEINTVWFQVPAIVIPIVFIDGVTTGGVTATAIAYSMFPKQPKYYIWYKGQYEIEAYTITDMFCQYEHRLLVWTWHTIEN